MPRRLLGDIIIDPGTKDERRRPEGDWVKPYRRGFLLQCCECGAVHTMNFRIKLGRIEFQMFANKRKTTKARKQRKFRFIVEAIRRGLTSN